MSPHGLPPPQAPPCLERKYLSSQKGGTLIAGEVTDLDGHLQRICNPDGYRPAVCENCGHGVLHVHDYRNRVLMSDPESPSVRVVRYLCASCAATWRILPGFMARHLWRSWRVVEAQALDDAPPRSWPSVPKRTRRRWKARLRSTARFVVQVFSTAVDGWLVSLGKCLGPDATRQQLVLAHAAMVGSAAGRLLADLAALIHRLAPGARVM